MLVNNDHSEPQRRGFSQPGRVEPLDIGLLSSGDNTAAAARNFTTTHQVFTTNDRPCTARHNATTANCDATTANCATTANRDATTANCDAPAANCATTDNRDATTANRDATTANCDATTDNCATTANRDATTANCDATTANCAPAPQLGLPPTRNTSPLAARIRSWHYYLAKAHTHFCQHLACPGLRSLAIILDTDPEDPITPQPAPTQCLNAIEGELLITMLYFGARLVPRGTDIGSIPSFDLANYPCSDSRITEAIDATLSKELAAGWLFTPATHPRWITPIYGKDESTPERQKVRMITDFSVPEGGAINDYAANQTFKMMRPEDTCALMRPYGFMTKVDLADAYRTVGVLPAHWELFSFRGPINGQLRILSSSRLVFGASVAAEEFCRATQATRAILAAEGIAASVVFSDDFWIITADAPSCAAALAILTRILEELGWTENIKKRTQPAQTAIHCGIQYDTNVDGKGGMQVTIPTAKMEKAQHLAAACAAKGVMTLRELQRAIGVFGHLTVAVWTGRAYLRRLIEASAAAEAAGNKIIKISKSMKLDFLFWKHVACERNGKAIILHPPPAQHGFLATDASDIGMGGYFNGAWFSVQWTTQALENAAAALPPQSRRLLRKDLWPNRKHGNSMWFIAYRETFAAYWAWLLWGPTDFKHRLILHHVDNTVTNTAINTLRTRHILLMNLVRHMAEIQVELSMRVRAQYIDTKRNYVADAASRGNMSKLHAALERINLEPMPLQPPFLPHTFSNPCFLTHRAKVITEAMAANTHASPAKGC